MLTHPRITQRFLWTDTKVCSTEDTNDYVRHFHCQHHHSFPLWSGSYERMTHHSLEMRSHSPFQGRHFLVRFPTICAGRVLREFRIKVGKLDLHSPSSPSPSSPPPPLPPPPPPSP